jgi:hypothetical protein
MILGIHFLQIFLFFSLDLLLTVLQRLEFWVLPSLISLVQCWIDGHRLERLKLALVKLLVAVAAQTKSVVE